MVVLIHSSPSLNNFEQITEKGKLFIWSYFKLRAMQAPALTRMGIVPVLLRAEFDFYFN